MFQLEKLPFPRCLEREDAVSRPKQIVLRDRSDLAYGNAAYLSDGIWKTENLGVGLSWQTEE